MLFALREDWRKKIAEIEEQIELPSNRRSNGIFLLSASFEIGIHSTLKNPPSSFIYYFIYFFYIIF